MPRIPPPFPDALSDPAFGESLTLRDAYRLMEIFVLDYHDRGDTPVSDFLCYAVSGPNGMTGDPAALPDFLEAWRKLKAANPAGSVEEA
jgi:hypothetical protein